ncbi:hypothetical protein OPKNFCMD_3400 [Methylobacterium crusticola]|uniref:Peptidase S24/S26A/S26B/S26C domain-containing protein n=1 Tax=Methylobacterium crusticola TaxID=1697972 RepID=A0ABQ4QZQ6_9HYPH|nr:helix-turn-helix transcriptional regulator [Methylobacterium crusticola]GJD50657.1 hypothetical protein OPKNFCMD_3400 [Methylobacterium crusticola]
MLSHDRIWSAIDHLAERHNLTASGLARRAGLDATSFNRSKRVGRDGRKRWPSTESLAKVLAATGASLDEFLRLVEPRDRSARTALPLIGSAHAVGRIGADGLPGGGRGWEAMEFPDLGREPCFAIAVQGGSLNPLYRDGDVLVVCATARLREGDRVVACLDGGAILAAELGRGTARAAELRVPGPGGPDRVLLATDVAWMARVMWVRH